MKSKCTKVFLFLLGIVTVLVAGEGTVTTWVPWWAVTECKKNLADTTMDLETHIDRLGLPFWVPEAVIDGEDTVVTGKVVKERSRWMASVDSSDILWFREWTRDNNIECLMTIGFWMLPDTKIDTMTNRINWELQKLAFHDNQEQLITDILSIVETYDLDGLDVDIEGLPTYREEYAGFVRAVSDSLHSRGKIITLDVMPSTTSMNGHTEWWPDYVGIVDALNIMAYQYLFEGSEHGYGGNLDNNKYSTLLEYGISLGYEASQLHFGLPGWLGEWGEGGRGSSILSHLKELRDLDTTVSIAIWDLRLNAPEWIEPDVWKKPQVLKAIDLLSTKPAITIDTATISDTELDLTWEIDESAAFSDISVSIQKGKFFAWEPIDTLEPTETNYRLNHSTVDDSLFYVIVSLLNSEGEIVDFDIRSFQKESGLAGFVFETTQDVAPVLSMINNQLSFSVPGAKQYELAIYSLNGRMLFREMNSVDGERVVCDLPSIAKGNYIVQLVTEVNSIVKKISIE